jgi:hypothetical protein
MRVVRVEMTASVLKAPANPAAKLNAASRCCNTMIFLQQRKGRDEKSGVLLVIRLCCGINCFYFMEINWKIMVISLCCVMNCLYLVESNWRIVI